jgi:glucosamine--fructose-6-phosphate aminotransferase (isomerizing)
MTHFLEDILRQSDELSSVIALLHGDARLTLEVAAAAIRGARHVYITGMGASWNAALGAGSLFHSMGYPVYMLDAAELLYSANIPEGSVLIVLSRSGQSMEIVRLVQKVQASRAAVIGITNFADGFLAQQADMRIVLPVRPDHGISTNTYISLAAGAAALASVVNGSFDAGLVSALRDAVAQTKAKVAGWQRQLEYGSWLLPGAAYCFLARGSSLASCYAAQLLWQEGVKTPAMAMGTDTFRHGPQETVMPGMRFMIWIDRQMRQADLAVVRDLKFLGASVMVIGSELEDDTSDFRMQLPVWPPGWQFLMDVMPAQLAAEALAGLSGADCDSFRSASYIVDTEQGLLGK